MEKLINDLNNIVNNSWDDISILVTELGNSKYIYSHNYKQKTISASIIKVPIMLAVLDEVKLGHINLNDKILVDKKDILNDTKVFEDCEDYYSLYELLSWMIINSDNTATNVIIKYFDFNKINHYIKNILNLKSTYLQRYMLDEKAISAGFNNYTSQEDMLYTFAKLFNREILNDELCNVAIEILLNQRCQDQIMRYIYQPVKYAHKTGSLDYLNHDVGVFNIDGKFFYVGVSIYNTKDKNGNKKLVGKIGKIIYEYLNKYNY